MVIGDHAGPEGVPARRRKDMAQKGDPWPTPFLSLPMKCRA